jgi:hypothetical protein
MSHGWPLVTPLPGARREQLRDSLRQIHNDAHNLRGGTYGTGHVQLTRYLAWTSTTVKTLGNQVRPADIDRLILTRGYERLVRSLAEPDITLLTFGTGQYSARAVRALTSIS